MAFYFPGAAILSVSTGNNDLWKPLDGSEPIPNQEVRESRTSGSFAQSQKFETISSCQRVIEIDPHRDCAYFRTGRRSLFLVLTQRIVASGNENADQVKWLCACVMCWPHRVGACVTLLFLFYSHRVWIGCNIWSIVYFPSKFGWRIHVDTFLLLMGTGPICVNLTSWVMDSWLLWRRAEASSFPVVLAWTRLWRHRSSPKSCDWALKDGAYYFYCAYVLRISRYSDFLLAVLTNTGIFLRGSKLCWESRT